MFGFIIRYDNGFKFLNLRLVYEWIILELSKTFLNRGSDIMVK